jgi:SPOR domain
MLRTVIKFLFFALAIFATIQVYAQTSTETSTAAKPKTKKVKKGSKAKKGSKDAELESYFTGSNKKGKKGKKGKDGKEDKKGDNAKNSSSSGIADIKSVLANRKKNSTPNAKPIDPAMANGNRPMIIGDKTVMGSVGTANGFRICIYNGNSRQEALATKQQFMKKYTNVHSYMKYSTPSYKISVGEYTDKKVAQKELKKIVVDFKSAFIMPDVVNVKNIIVYQSR